MPFVSCDEFSGSIVSIDERTFSIESIGKPVFSEQYWAIAATQQQ